MHNAAFSAMQLPHVYSLHETGSVDDAVAMLRVCAVSWIRPHDDCDVLFGGTLPFRVTSHLPSHFAQKPSRMFDKCLPPEPPDDHVCKVSCVYASARVATAVAARSQRL